MENVWTALFQSKKKELICVTSNTQYSCHYSIYFIFFKKGRQTMQLADSILYANTLALTLHHQAYVSIKGD